MKPQPPDSLIKKEKKRFSFFKLHKSNTTKIDKPPELQREKTIIKYIRHLF